MSQVNVHRYCLFTVFCTVLLLCAGALVTSTSSGLAVPDWPLSFGQFFPPMVGGVLFEHGHRLVAGSVALLTCIQCFILIRFQKRRVVKRLSIAAVCTVLIQAGLGGVTVLLKLPPQVSIVHACTAQIFFCLMVLMATLTSPHWETKVSKPIEKGPFYYFAYCLNAAFFLQLLMGATMRHTGAGLAIPDFPMAFGQWLPPFFTDAILIHFMHRTFAFVLLFLVGLFVAILYKKYPEQLVLTTFAGLLFSLVTFQILLGAMSIWLRKPVVITMSHLAVGALCFGCSVVVTSLMARQIKTEEIFIQWSPA